MMNISYTYRPSYLITNGIGFIFIFNLVFLSLIFAICHEFLNNDILKIFIISILTLTIEPIIICYGSYNIIKGRKQFEIHFNEGKFRSFKNSIPEINIPIVQIENAKIIHGSVFSSAIPGGFKFKKIELELKEMEKFQLTIRGKKWISKFLEFIELLKNYCNEKQIQFIELYDD